MKRHPTTTFLIVTSLAAGAAACAGDATDNGRSESVEIDIEPGAAVEPDSNMIPFDQIAIATENPYSVSNVVPIAMYLAGRNVSGVGNDGAGDQILLSELDGWPGDTSVLQRAFENYRAMSAEQRDAIFDQLAVELTANLEVTLRADDLAALFSPPFAGGWLDDTPPAAPSGLDAANAYQLPDPDVSGSEKYRIRLTWADQSGDEDGFVIRRSNGDASSAGEIAVVPPNTTQYLDELTEPADDSDQFCYQVTAFTTQQLVATGETPGRIESEATAAACSTYGFTAPPPQPDADLDGIPDAMDECVYEHAGNAGFGALGCPDSDGDWVADKDDLCPLVWGDPPVPGDASSAVPDDGCPYLFTLRWMGMDVLNNTGAFAYPHFDFVDEFGQSAGLHQNEVDDECTPGEEPYLIFNWTNGINQWGSVNDGTAQWCCGDGVDVEGGDCEEPDSDPCGEEYPNQLSTLLDTGLIVFPGASGSGSVSAAEIEPDMGLIVAMTLMEKDFTVTVTTDDTADGFQVAIKLGVATAGAVAGCVAGGAPGCLFGVAKVIKDVITGIFGVLQAEPTTTTVDDPDDFQGVETWAIDRVSAKFLTADDGAYGFQVTVPMEHDVSCLGWEPCGVGNSVPITMRTTIDLCLHREGLSDAQIATACAPYQPVSPWPQT